MSALDDAVKHWVYADEAAAELAALREQVKNGDKRVLQLMGEIEMREGMAAARWAMLREILEGGGK